MAKVTLPPRNNIFAVMMIITAIVFVLGIVMNGSKLSGYKIEPAKVPTVTLPEVGRAPVQQAQPDVLPE